MWCPFAIIIHFPFLKSYQDYKVIGLLFLDGVLNWLQNIIAFSVLHLVTPLTYAIANCSKRIFVIGLSLFILGNPVTAMNIVGMLTAIFGVLYYNKVNFSSLFSWNGVYPSSGSWLLQLMKWWKRIAWIATWPLGA